MNDKVKVTLVSGKGGDGAIAFRREKSVERGGPYGGNGGKGGSIYIRAKEGIESLANYRFGKTILASDGENGFTKLQYGKDAKDIILDVPCGTVIEDLNGDILADLYKDGMTYLACKGGRGGRGNACFKSSTRRTPNIAENGLPGEKKSFYFELKLLADVGLVGFPNAGKSSFLKATTRANPLIANYPFTTLEPQLGVAFIDVDKSFVIADIPGLIQGASEGKGLGLTFLRHVERCSILLHMIDVSSSISLKDDFEKINEELFKYDSRLKDKTMIIALNKIDLPYDKKMVDDFVKEYSPKYKIYLISCENNKGISPLLKELYKEVSSFKKKEVIKAEVEKVYTPNIDNSREVKVEITKNENGSYEINSPRIIRTKRLINLKTDEGLDRLLNYLDRVGVNDKLKEMGVKDGSTIVLDGFEFEYYN